MSKRFHVNEKGNSGECNATKRPCPLGFSAEEHFPTEEAAREAYERTMRERALPPTQTSASLTTLEEVLAQVRQSVKNSEGWRTTSAIRRRELLQQAEEEWRKTHKADVQALSPKREVWNTEVPKLSPKECKSLAASFPPVPQLGQAEAEELGRRMAEEHHLLEESLSQEEYDALSFYRLSGYEVVNSLMRYGKVDREATATSLEVEEIQRRTAALATALRREEDSQERILYRQQEVPTGWTAYQYVKRYFPVGEVVEEKGFLSTSEDPGYIAGHLHKNKGKHHVVFQVQARGGVSLQPREGENSGSIQSLEKERLLSPGRRFRVVGYKRENFTVSEERKALCQRYGTIVEGQRWSPWEVPEVRKAIPERTYTVVMLAEVEE